MSRSRISPRWAAAFAAAVVTPSLTAAPTVDSITPAPGSTVSTLTSVTVVFSEPVSGVQAGDFLVNAEGAVGVTGTGAGPYVYSFTEPLPGTVSVSFDFDHGIAGTAGTGAFDAGDGWTYELNDTVAPTVAALLSEGITLAAIVPQPGSTINTLAECSIVFSEPVSGVTAGQLAVGGAAATEVTGTGAGPYVFTVPTPPNGDVACVLSGGGVTDSAGNVFGGDSWQVTLNPAARGDVVINEFVAANANGLDDADGDSPDWLELHNPGAAPVSLLGWSLSTDSEDPGAWVFPDVSIPAGGFLVVFASGKDRKPVTGELHTNFVLDLDGGFLGLYGPESPLAAADELVNLLGQRYDISYGRTSGGDLAYFSTPTPGAANPATGLTGLVPEPDMSVARGFFAEPFSLVMSCADPEATVRFTLDGTPPVDTSTAYVAPLQISGTTVLRAAAFAPDKIQSRPVTHSYLYLEHVLDQPEPPYDHPDVDDDNDNPALPTVGGETFPISWGTQSTGGFPGQIRNLGRNEVPADYGMDREIIDDPNRYNDDGEIDEVNGITNLERIRRSFRELPLLSIVMPVEDMFGRRGLHPNSLVKGERFEFPCSIELLLPDGTTGFATTCGIRMHGNASREPRKCPKHGFKFNFTGSYGAAKLEYPLFPGTAATEFDDIIVRGDFNSSWLHWNGSNQRLRGTRHRDAFCKDTFRDMGRAAGHSRYVHLFINGLYWGTYDPTEQENADFAANTFGGSEDDYDVVEQGQLKNGTIDAYNAMRAIRRPVDNAGYEEMKEYLDVPWLIDYMLLHFYLGHEDWGGDINKNWYAVRHRDGGKYRYLPWDMENLMWEETANRVTVSSPPTGLHTNLITNEQYQLDFADAVHKHLVAPDGVLRAEAGIARWKEWRAVMQNAIAAESARWGDYRRDVHRHESPPYILFEWNDEWMAEQNRLTDEWFPRRPDILMSQLQRARLYPSTEAPVFRDGSTGDPIGSEKVSPGFTLAMDMPAGQSGVIYYTTDGADPRVYFDTTGETTPTAQTYSTPLVIDAPTVVKARVLDGTDWSALIEATYTMGPDRPTVRITELHYNPSAGQGRRAGEFIEFQNTGPMPVDVGAWSMRGVDFVFPWGTVIDPGARIVIVNNDAPNIFAANHPGVQVTGYYAGALDNGGERISLLDPEGNVVSSVEFNNGAPWPAEADGGGHSLEVIAAEGDLQDAFNWKPSTTPNGTPARANGAAVAPPVFVSEFLAANGGSYMVGTAAPDYVELQNPGGTAVVVDGWQVSASPRGGSVVIPAGTTIAPGGRLVVHADDAAVDGAAFQLPDRLDGDQGEIAVYDASGNRVDGLRYGPQSSGHSFGRALGGSWALGNPSPGGENGTIPTGALAALRINEFLADPFPGGDDWFEIANTDGTLPVVLTGLHVSADAAQTRIDTPSAAGPGQPVRLFANTGSQRGNAVSFGLPGSGATIGLADEAGNPIDAIPYGSQSEGVSQGRIPDGTGAVTTLAHPSPGVANHTDLSGPVSFNEVAVLGGVGNAPWGRRPAWFELAAPAGAGADIAGWDVRTIGRESDSWTVPAGVRVPGAGFIVVWCDPQEPESTADGDDLNAALPIGSGRYQSWGLELVNPAGQVVDRVVWGQQLDGTTIGRTTEDRWALMAAVSRGAANTGVANTTAPAAVTVNEWHASTVAGSALGESFLELYNAGAHPADVSGLWLSDEPSEVGRRKWKIPALTFVPPRGHLWFSSEDGTTDPTKFGFDLDPGGEFVRLGFDDPDTTAVDSVSYGRSPDPGRSGGRLPDGAPTMDVLHPSPGSTNLTAPGPVIERHPRPAAGLVGASVSLSIVSPDAASYQWQRDGSNIAGATAATLEIAALALADDGFYTCIATNALGSTTSDGAQVSVLYTLAQWAAAYGIAANPDADSDSDGFTDGEEFTAGTDPTVPATTAERAALTPVPGFVDTVDGAYLTLDIALDPNALGSSSATGETSLDLTNWNETAPAGPVSLGDSAAGVPQSRIWFAVPAGASEYFARMQGD